MIWIIPAVLGIVALVANEIRLAPEQDDDYEVQMQEHCRRLQQDRDAAGTAVTSESEAA